MLYACAVNDVDSTACDMLAEVAEFAAARDGRLILADVKTQVRKRLDHHARAGALPRIPQPESPLPEAAAPTGHS